MVLGTAGYMAPEVMRGGTGNLASDVFSFGVLAHEMLCGERPYSEFEILAMSHGVAMTATAKIEHRCPELPSDLAGLLDRCLAVRAEERPDAEALRVALAAAENASESHGLVREDARAHVG
jgi:serine/threonine-protein kinase